MSADSVQQSVLPAGMTSSTTGTFYFAYGSNLSSSQMSLRLQADPASSKPVAVARLDAHAWIICERGYANVVALPEANKASDNNVVWGIVYNLSTEDEARLDMFEGHDDLRNPSPRMNPNPAEQQRKPYLQGGWDYNKHYLPVTVTKWLANPDDYGVQPPDWTTTGQGVASIRVLAYIDEMRTKPGTINQEYIGRMNRAIRECVQMGIPSRWIDSTMRQHIPDGIEVDHEGYIGTDKGYIEAEATETASDLKERVLRDVQAGRK